MNVVEDCAECQRLTASYEAATIDWFRLEGNLRIAEYGRDEESFSSLAEQLHEIAEKRLQLRKAIEKHWNAAHPRVVAASV